MTYMGTIDAETQWIESWSVLIDSTALPGLVADVQAVDWR